MKKALLVIVAVFVVLIMLSGAFSGGVIVGRFIAPKAVPSAQVEVLPPQTGQNSTESAPTPLSPTKSAPPTRTGTPNNLVKLFEPF